ncbi:MAG: hypothetical protein V1660_04180 [archaeon]
MKLIDGLEGKILKKYLKAKPIEEEDKLHIEQLASVGLMTYQYSIRKNPLQVLEVAKTTSFGYSAIF